MMTRAQFVKMIAIAETNDRLKDIGDGGRAGGKFQMHWDWRVDYWPEWAWEALALIDRAALEWFIQFDRTGKPRRLVTARELADLYNLGHPAPDAAYDERCLA